MFGYCLDKKDYRMFKLNRLWNLQLIENTFSPRDVPLNKVNFDNRFISNAAFHLKAIFSASEKYRIIEEYGVDSYTLYSNEKLLFQHDFASYENMRNWVFSFGDKVEILEPKELYCDRLQQAKNIISVFSALETAYAQKECGKDLGKIKNMFQINYFSQVYFLSAIAPVLQKQLCGEIIVLGSTAGEYGMPDNYAFGSTKAALHIWLQGFQAQMAQYHVNVTTVKADDWDTVGERKYSFYQKPLDPEACARSCLHYAQKKVKVCYFPWYTALTVPLRRYAPYLYRSLKK